VQRSISGQEDYLDCEELYSGEGSDAEGYSDGSEPHTPDSLDHEGGTGGDHLPLISPEWTPDYTFKVSVRSRLFLQAALPCSICQMLANPVTST
jgi:hypothetical protein